MYRLKHSKKLLCFLIFPVVSSGMIGCSYDRKYYEFPTNPYNRGFLRSLKDLKGTGVQTVNGMKVDFKKEHIYIKDYDVSIPYENVNIKITDADVLGFTDDVKKVLQRRSNLARRVRMGSGTGQILAAAAGATLGFIAHANVETVAALAAVSAVIPELQTIWEARGRAETYNNGLDLIQKAEARYYEKKTKGGPLKDGISSEDLTPEGVELLNEVTASIQVMGKALVNLIPTVEELQAATGRVKDELEQIKVVPETVNLKYNASQTVHVLYGKAIAYSIDGVDVVKIDPTDFEQGRDTFKIVGVGAGTANVTVFNSHGKSKNIDVTVVRKIPVADAGGNRTVTVGTTTTLYGSGIAPDRSDINEYKWSIVSPQKDSNPVFTGTLTATPEFTPDKIGTYTLALTVKDKKGECSDPSTITITAKNEKPKASVEPIQSVTVGSTVKLNGSKSKDPDEHKLKEHKWTIKTPQGKSESLTGETATFTANEVGKYEVTLIVNDGYEDSDSSTVTITAENKKPIANTATPTGIPTALPTAALTVSPTLTRTGTATPTPVPTVSPIVTSSTTSTP